MANRETDIQQRIRLALGRLPGVVIWRNTGGYDERARQEYGLRRGASDLIGICDGRFFALEVKTATGRPSKEQIQFLKIVRANGGFGAIVRSPEDALAAVGRCRKGMCE